MDYRMLSETLSTLAILEAAATAAAAPLLSDEEIDELQAINDAMAGADKAGDLGQVSRHNRKFHLACYGRCPNSWMLDLITKTANRSFVGRRSLFFEVPHRPEHSVQEHQEIVRLLRERAPGELIEAAVRRHKQPTIDLVESRAHYVFEPTDVIQ
jgi:DNA-binding GntR family transcriptional regulator